MYDAIVSKSFDMLFWIILSMNLNRIKIDGNRFDCMAYHTTIRVNIDTMEFDYQPPNSVADKNPVVIKRLFI